MKSFSLNFLISILLVLFLFSCDKPEEKPEIKADFSVSSNNIVAGNSLTYSDNSAGNPNHGSWTFEGGTPASSDEQNPVVTYNEPGTYAVTLTASNSEKSDQVVKEGLIVVEENCEINDKAACALVINQEVEVKYKISEKKHKKWYSINVEQPGVLITTVSSVPAELATKIKILNEKEEVIRLSHGYSGVAGETVSFENLVNAGKYFIRLSDHSDKFSNKEYKLLVSLNTDDPNEINNSFDEATELALGETIEETFRPSQAEDFFIFTTDKAGNIEIVVSNIDPKLKIKAVLYDDKQGEIS